MSCLDKIKLRCKYAKTCDYYGFDQYVCNHCGGSYCGEYKKRERVK